jgi:hypothetical protein
MTGPQNNGWEQRFGAKRRALDRALLAECERQIAKEERADPIPPVDRDTERRRIALAFGRPLT